MLTQDSSRREENLNPIEETCLSKEQADIEALRAAYWNVKNASAQAVGDEDFLQHLNLDETISSQAAKSQAQPAHSEQTPSALEEVLINALKEKTDSDSSVCNLTSTPEPPIALVEIVQEAAPYNPMYEGDDEDEKALNFLFQKDLYLELPTQVESWLVRLCNRPKLAAGIVGMCLLASSVYVGLGYWFLSASVSNAAEPVNMMQIEENSDKTTGKPALNHIRTLQQQPAPKDSKTPKNQQGTLLALATTPAKVAAMIVPEEGSDSTRIREPELLGRHNPFEPLVYPDTPGQPTISSGPPEKKDVLQDMQYTGFIGNTDAKKKLAIIKVADPGNGSSQTLIKKVGDTFYVSGEKVILKGISKTSVQLVASGENRKLTLSPYEITSTASATSSAGNTAGTTTSSSSTGTTASAGSTGTPANTTSNRNAGSVGNSNSAANPQLQEP